MITKWENERSFRVSLATKAFVIDVEKPGPGTGWRRTWVSGRLRMGCAHARATGRFFLSAFPQRPTPVIPTQGAHAQRERPGLGRAARLHHPAILEASTLNAGACGVSKSKGSGQRACAVFFTSKNIKRNKLKSRGCLFFINIQMYRLKRARR